MRAAGAVWEYVNLTLRPSESYLTSAVFAARHVLLWATKNGIWGSAITATTHNNHETYRPFHAKNMLLQFNFFKASALFEHKITDWKASVSCFGTAAISNLDYVHAASPVVSVCRPSVPTAVWREAHPELAR